MVFGDTSFLGGFDWVPVWAVEVELGQLAGKRVEVSHPQQRSPWAHED